MRYEFDGGEQDWDGDWDAYPSITNSSGRELFVFCMDEEDVVSVEYLPEYQKRARVDYMGFYDTLRACEVFQL